MPPDIIDPIYLAKKIGDNAIYRRHLLLDSIEAGYRRIYARRNIFSLYRERSFDKEIIRAPEPYIDPPWGYEPVTAFQKPRE